MLESRNSIPFFSYLPIEMAKLKPSEILPRQNNKVYIYIYIYTLLFVYIYIYISYCFFPSIFDTSGCRMKHPVECLV